ncbi:MAG: glycosyltransferase family 39 protein, partial [Anaerolineales bacterium]|nr:glycosyltransferase family 39 protein [Anaerolineales bacterium]
SLMEALAPPVHFDALVYHLELPKDFIQAGGLTFTPENRYWGNPLLAEMLYTWAMLLGGVQTASALGWIVGIVSVLGIGSLVQRYGKDSAWAAIVAILVGETLWSSLAWAYADWFAILYGAALLVTLDHWCRHGSHRWTILSACMAGFAIGVKYPAGLALLGACAAMLLTRIRKVSGRDAALFLAVTIIVVSPWLIKNWLAAGSPLYPYLGSSPWITAVEQSFYQGIKPQTSLLMALLLPIRATIIGAEGTPGFSASIGPLLLGLLPGVLVGWKDRDDLLKTTAIFVIVGWMGWAAASMSSVLLGQSRIYFVILPAWSLLAGFGYRALQDVRIRTIRLGRLASALVLLSLSLASFQAVKDLTRHKTVPVLLGIEAQESYLENRLGAYVWAMKAVEAIEGEGTVVTLWEPRGFYCRPVCLPDVWTARWYVLRRTLGDNDAILNQWRDQGVTHILLYKAGMDFMRSTDPIFTTEDWLALEDLLGNLEPVEAVGDAYTLYRIP